MVSIPLDFFNGFAESCIIKKQNEWKDLMHRMEAACEDTQIDREIPEWDNNQYPWHFDLSVKAESYSLVSDQPIRPSTILQHLRPVTQELHLKVMELPHAKGTFRRAYYAKDKITGKRYVLKQFHIQRGKEADYKDCQRVAKMYAFTRYCAALFENELFIAQQRRFAEMGGTRYHLTNHYFDIHSLTYVNCYYAHVKPIFQFDDSLEDTAVMIEPLLPSFQKWINNDIEDRFADARDTNPHVEALSTFIHWTYERSERAFIISDLQGVKFMLPLNVTSNDIDTVMANQLPFTDTDFSYGERVIKWILSDPAVHFLKEPSSSSSTTAKDSDASSVRSSSRKNDKFANELKDALQVDFDGNLGLQAETLLFERHICGPMCNVLGLSTLIR